MNLKKIINLIEDLVEIVYIIDLDNNNLIYMNTSAKNKFLNNHEDYQNKKCSEILDRGNTNCRLCKETITEVNQSNEWIYYDTLDEKDYIVRENVVILDDKRKVKIVKLFFTELLNSVFDKAVKLKKIEEFLLSCVKTLHKNTDYHVALDGIIKLVGEFTNADRVYIFDILGDIMNNTFEWCNEGVTPEIESLQGLDSSLINWWLDSFNRDECFVIYDLEDIKETEPESYEILSRQNIKTLLTAPLKKDNQLFGYIGLDNPDINKMDYLLSIFDTLGYFIASIYLKKETEEYLTKLSYHDLLTKLYNRNKYIHDIEDLSGKKYENIGVLFIDLNDFKETNDRFGHFVGDEMLIKVANILQSVFKENLTYRYGGDEFIAICLNTSKEKFDILFNEFKDSLMAQNFSASIGYVHSEKPCDIQQIIKIADTNMYEEKAKYYKKQL